MSRLHSAAILAMSVIVCALSIGVAVFGANRDGLYADPSRLEAASPP